MLRERRIWRALLVMMGVAGLAACTGCLRSSNLRPPDGPLPALAPAGGPSLGEPAVAAPTPTVGRGSPQPALSPAPSSASTSPAPAGSGPAGALSSQPNPSAPAPIAPQAMPAPVPAGSEAAVEPQPAPAPMPARDAPKPQAAPAPAPTPLLDAAIQRVEAVTREHREALRSGETDPPAPPAHAPRNPPRIDLAPAMPAPPAAGGAPPALDPADPTGALLSAAAREAANTAAMSHPADSAAAPLPEPARLIVLPAPAELPAPGSSVPAAPNAGHPSEAPPPPAPDPSRAGPTPAMPPAQAPTLAVVLGQEPETADDEPPIASQDPKPVASVETPARSEPAVPSAAPAAEEPPRLEIAELRLCRNVLGFGSFEPVDPTALKAGQRLLVYWEMTGLEYQARGEAFVSRLAAHLELRADGNGAIVWEQAPGIAEDTCRRTRRDYYASYPIELPRSLQPGSYRLRLIQTDLIADQTTSKEIPIAIAP